MKARDYEEVLKPEFPDAVDGQDYVVLGYKAGNQGVINVINYFGRV